jgi:phosphate transport system protein
MEDTRRTFHLSLDAVKADIVRLGALVIEGIPLTTELLLGDDSVDGEQLLAHDDVLDHLSISIEDSCFHLLATQQPMASDLRALVTAIRLSSELERSGDLVVNIARSAFRIRGAVIDPPTRGLIHQLSEESRRLVEMAIDAYTDGDVVAAAALDVLDDQVDAIHRDFIEHIIESCRSGVLDVQVAVQLALVGRYYERIADHAVNVGERVRYMVDGWLPEHGESQTGAAS